MKQVSLHEVTRSNWRATLGLTVRPEQQRFISESVPIAAIALAKAYIRPAGLIWTPYAFVSDDAMVGFVELAHEVDSVDNYWLFHFFIDQRFQGQGYGKQALGVFVEFVRQHHPRAHALQLTVHPENAAAQQLYRQTGFAPTGAMRDGEPVYRLALSAA